MDEILYNPAFLSDAEAIRQFVVRTHELRQLVDTLEQPYLQVNPHTLVVGGRGLGKSMLLRRVVAEVQVRTELRARWFPVVFPEETYEVGNLGELWLEALRVLAQRADDPELGALHSRLHKDRDAERVRRTALAALLGFARDRELRLLLVIENLDMLLTDNLDDRQAWGLRGALQSAPELLLLASAVRRFEGVTAHSQPFYDSLRRIELAPLSVEELNQLWGSVAGVYPGRQRCQALRILTGGSPRLVRLLARLSHGTRLRDILDNLTGLVDQHTAYFKANIEALSGQQRRVFLATATLWRPATAGQIAEEARLEEGPTGVALQRLVAQGRLEVVGQRGKSRLYQVSERLYNLYHLMRRGGGQDPRLRALLDFLVLFLDPSELGRVVRGAGGEGGEAWPTLLTEVLHEHRPNPMARAELLRHVPGEVLRRLSPRELRVARGRPEELLALLQREDGAEWVGAAERMLERRSEVRTDTLLRMAERVLELGWGEEIPFWASLYIVLHEPQRALELAKGAREDAAFWLLNAAGWGCWYGASEVVELGHEWLAFAGTLTVHELLTPAVIDACDRIQIALRTPDAPAALKRRAAKDANAHGSLEELIHHGREIPDGLTLLREALAPFVNDSAIAAAATVQIGMELQDSEGWDQAVPALLTRCPELPAVWLLACDTALERGDLPRAEHHARRALSLGAGLEGWGRLWCAMGPNVQAAEAWREAAQRNPDDPRVWALCFLAQPRELERAWSARPESEQLRLHMHLRGAAFISRLPWLGELAWSWRATRAPSEPPAVHLDWLLLAARLGHTEPVHQDLEGVLVGLFHAGLRGIEEVVALELADTGLESWFAELTRRLPDPDRWLLVREALVPSLDPLELAEEEYGALQRLREVLQQWRTRQPWHLPPIYRRQVLPPPPLSDFQAPPRARPRRKRTPPAASVVPSAQQAPPEGS